jgi:hypothetical protein
MTERRDLKRRIRERQEKTGERYTTARAHVLESPKSNLVVELHDVTEQARAIGLTCAVRVTSSLWRSGDRIRGLLEQLRDILSGPVDAPVMQAVALRGAADELGSGTLPLMLRHLGDFLTSIENGLRGPALGGRVLSFETDFDGQRRTVIAQVRPRHAGEPMLMMSVFREDSAGFFDSIELWDVWASPRWRGEK